jgi:hypothetical protein
VRCVTGPWIIQPSLVMILVFRQNMPNRPADSRPGCSRRHWSVVVRGGTAFAGGGQRWNGCANRLYQPCFVQRRGWPETRATDAGVFARFIESVTCTPLMRSWGSFAPSSDVDDTLSGE